MTFLACKPPRWNQMGNSHRDLLILILWRSRLSSSHRLWQTDLQMNNTYDFTHGGCEGTSTFEYPYSQLWPCGLPAIMNTLLLRIEATSPSQTTVEPLLSGYLLNSHPIRRPVIKVPIRAFLLFLPLLDGQSVFKRPLSISPRVAV